jgi:hypothetical protein
MKYRFDRWMYRDITASTTSGCFGPERLTLSAQDRKTASEIYPRSPEKVKALTKERLKVLNQVAKLKNLTSDAIAQINTNIDTIK